MYLKLNLTNPAFDIDSEPGRDEYLPAVVLDDLLEGFVSIVSNPLTGQNVVQSHSPFRVPRHDVSFVVQDEVLFDRSCAGNHQIGIALS